MKGPRGNSLHQSHCLCEKSVSCGAKLFINPDDFYSEEGGRVFEDGAPCVFDLDLKCQGPSTFTTPIFVFSCPLFILENRHIKVSKREKVSMTDFLQNKSNISDIWYNCLVFALKLLSERAVTHVKSSLKISHNSYPWRLHFEESKYVSYV